MNSVHNIGYDNHDITSSRLGHLHGLECKTEYFILQISGGRFYVFFHRFKDRSILYYWKPRSGSSDFHSETFEVH
jgi:hypothetical protein